MGGSLLLARLFGGACLCGSVKTEEASSSHCDETAPAASKEGRAAAAADISTCNDKFATDIACKDIAAVALCDSAVVADTGSSSSCIPAAYGVGSKQSGDSQSQSTATRCSDTASTSYPTSYGDEWDALGAYMTTANEMEACVDAALEGSIKSAQHMFCRYDMDMDMRLCPQDYYDLMLELNLALPYPDYQRFVDNSFAVADHDHDGALTIDDFIPLYKCIAALRRAFRRQDHHSNGQIDRYDFYQVLRELEVDGGQQGLQALADKAFSEADTHGRGIVNFGQVLVWYSSYLLACRRSASSASKPQQ